MSAFVIARLTFREAGRRKILLAAFLLGLVYLVIYGVGFYYVNQDTTRSQFGPGIIELNQILCDDFIVTLLIAYQVIFKFYLQLNLRIRMKSHINCTRI